MEPDADNYYLMMMVVAVGEVETMSNFVDDVDKRNRLNVDNSIDDDPLYDPFYPFYH